MDVAEQLTLDYPYYLEQFNRVSYAGLFQRYKDRCMPFFRALDQAGAEAAADALLVRTERLARPWKRKLLLFDMQRFFALYLIPAALDSGCPQAAAFAELLRQRWNERYPKNRFQSATYEEIAGGFRMKIFGFEIGR